MLFNYPVLFLSISHSCYHRNTGMKVYSSDINIDVRARFINSITFSGQDILLSTSVTNLGVMDSHLTFQDHIKHLCKTSFFHQRNIAKLRPIITFGDAENLSMPLSPPGWTIVMRSSSGSLAKASRSCSTFRMYTVHTVRPPPPPQGTSLSTMLYTYPPLCFSTSPETPRTKLRTMGDRAFCSAASQYVKCSPRPSEDTAVSGCF